MYFLRIPDLIPGPDLEALVALCHEIKYVDGRRESNPDSDVKQNLQADINDPKLAKAQKIIQRALAGNRQFHEFVVPKKVGPPMINRYQPGMAYGAHTDAAVMPINRLMRADISCTIFLAGPQSYDGGELCIHVGSERINIKGAPGEAVFYATSALHEVMPVTRGERLVAVFFAQSQIADPNKREILFDLAEILENEGDRLSEEAQRRFTNAHTNLHRMWAQI